MLKKPTLHLPAVTPVEMWEYPHEVDAILVYTKKQHEMGQPLHSMLNQNLEQLEEYGYPEEKIRQIREEFEKPVEERRFDLEEYASREFADWLNSVREMLHKEFADEGVPKEVREKLIEESIIGETLSKIPLTDIDRLRRSMQARARNFLVAIRKAGEAIIPVEPVPPRKVPAVEPAVVVGMDIGEIFSIIGPGGTIEDARRGCEAEIKHAKKPLAACSIYAQLVTYFTRASLSSPDPEIRRSHEKFLKGEKELVDKIEDLWGQYEDDGKIAAKIIDMFLQGVREILEERYGEIKDISRLSQSDLNKSRTIAEASAARAIVKKKKKPPAKKPEITIPIEPEFESITYDRIKEEIAAKIKRA